MRTCPVCDMELAPVDYEGFRVMKCGGCKGHLVSLSRCESIKRVDRKSRQELQAEVAGEFTRSSTQRLKCPQCHLPMRKRRIDLPVLELQADECESCALVWLDGGELALLQLGYEARSQFIDAQEMKRRMQELEASPERKARFEENLARLPESRPADGDILGDFPDDRPGSLLWDLLRTLMRRGWLR